MKTNQGIKIVCGAALVLLTWCALQWIYSGITFVRYWNWDRHMIRDADGVAELARPEVLDGQGPTWLLVHGFGDTPNVWHPLAASLKEKGFRVRTLRLEGWGESPRQKSRTSAKSWRKQIRRVVKEEKGAGREVWLGAHSMGACIVANLLLDGELNDLDGAVLYAPMFGISSTRSPVLTPRQWHGVAMRVLPMVGTIESVFPDDMRRNQPRPRSLRDPYVTKNIYREVFEQIDAVHRRDPVVNCPLLVVIPGEDRVVDGVKTHEWYTGVQASRGKDWRVEADCGHTLPLDFDSDLEAKNLLKWIQQQQGQDVK